MTNPKAFARWIELSPAVAAVIIPALAEAVDRAKTRLAALHALRRDITAPEAEEQEALAWLGTAENALAVLIAADVTALGVLVTED